MQTPRPGLSELPHSASTRKSGGEGDGGAGGGSGAELVLLALHVIRKLTCEGTNGLSDGLAAAQLMQFPFGWFNEECCHGRPVQVCAWAPW